MALQLLFLLSINSVKCIIIFIIIGILVQKSSNLVKKLKKKLARSIAKIFSNLIGKTKKKY